MNIVPFDEMTASKLQLESNQATIDYLMCTPEMARAMTRR